MKSCAILTLFVIGIYLGLDSSIFSCSLSILCFLLALKFLSLGQIFVLGISSLFLSEYSLTFLNMSLEIKSHAIQTLTLLGSTALLYSTLYKIRSLPILSAFIELSLLSSAIYHILGVYELYPTRPYWLIDWCIENNLEVQDVLLGLTLSIFIFWFMRFSEVWSHKRWLYIMPLYGILLLIISTEVNSPLTSPPSPPTPPSSSEQESESSSSQKEQAPNQDQQPIALLRFLSYYQSSARGDAIYIAEGLCHSLDIKEAISQPEGCFQKNISYLTPYAYSHKEVPVLWERYDLLNTPSSKDWLLQGQSSPSIERPLSSKHITRFFQGEIFSSFAQLRLKSQQKLKPSNYLIRLKNALDQLKRSRSPEQTQQSQELTQEIKSLMSSSTLTPQQSSFIKAQKKELLATLEEFERDMDTAKLRALLKIYRNWRIKPNQQAVSYKDLKANIQTTSYCQLLQGPLKLKLTCATLLLRELGLSARLISGYKVPYDSIEALNEVLIRPHHRSLWIEVFVEDYGSNIVGWRTVDIGEASPSQEQSKQASKLNDHELKQLISHWIDQLKTQQQTQHEKRPLESLPVFVWPLILALMIFIFDRFSMLFFREFGSPRQVYEYTLTQLSYINLKRHYGESRRAFIQRIATSSSSELGDIFRHLTEMYVLSTQAHLAPKELEDMRQIARLISKKITSKTFKSSQIRLQYYTLLNIDQPKESAHVESIT